MGLDQFLLLGLGRVNDIWFGFEKFPLKIPNFTIFPLWIKNNHTGSEKYPGQRKVGILFSVGQKYARVRAPLYHMM